MRCDAMKGKKVREEEEQTMAVNRPFIHSLKKGTQLTNIVAEAYEDGGFASVLALCSVLYSSRSHLLSLADFKEW